MSIDGLMRTSVAGMTAQSNKLGAVAGNIANASTVGYKRVDAQFSTLLLDAPGTSYSPGGVETAMRYGISQQGVLQTSDSRLDLAISGEGFMLVSSPDGGVALTRAGNFVADGEGNLVNAAGFKLLGYPITNGDASSIVVNGTAGLVPVTVGGKQLQAKPTTEAKLGANLPSSASEVAAGDLPSDNSATSVSSARTSVVVYGNLGEEITLDVHFAKTTVPGEWEVAVYNAADRDPSGGFPYANGPIGTTTLTFDSLGQLDPSSGTPLSLAIPGGATMDLDLGNMTQLATDFSVLDVSADGNPAGSADSLEIGKDGTVYQTYGNGARNALYRIPLATVTSPDRLTAKTGNTFAPSIDSGDMRVGVPQSGGFGSLVSGALESSTVDMASELTDMIAAQRSYTANSRVFQTGSELMDVIVNLKR
jgi:flagellar hook protein FlgE